LQRIAGDSRWNTPENIELDWQKFMDKKNTELQRLNGVYDKLLAKAGVTYIEGRGKLVDAHTVDVDGRRYTVSGDQHALRAVLSVALRRKPVSAGCTPVRAALAVPTLW
jgi:pyruvate/2-oxoglutarate dehydrogenase complex dihydrolipoamide dehydrogenase (E3) component